MTEQPHELYDCVKRRRLRANLRNDGAGLDDVAALLTELRDASQAIGNAPAATAPTDPARPDLTAV